MASPTGHTLFKKKEGILSFTSDYRAITWTPASGGPATVSLPVTNITSNPQWHFFRFSPKVMLKIFEKSETASEPITYLFHFNAQEAKAEAQAVKDLLSRLLADLRSSDTNVTKLVTTTATPVPNGEGPGGITAALASSSGGNTQPIPPKWFDDSQLKTNIELQQSLMKKDKSLHQTYMNAISTKPDSMTSAAFNSQFWSMRINLLRAHAIEINQKKGAYNVLSTVKPRTVDGELKLNISVEQVQMIFAQHPLIKRIYNENVPRLSEAEFWSRFFLSKLAKKLKGERVTDNEPADAIFDKYNLDSNTEDVHAKTTTQSVPHIIDIEGNEENQGGFKGGNAKDVEMRPRANIPIVKTLNSLSEKIMANVPPSDNTSYDSRGLYDASRELILRDLRGDGEEQRIMLNIKERNNFFSSKDSPSQKKSGLLGNQRPSEVLLKMQHLHTVGQNKAKDTGLQINIDLDIDSDSDKESKPGANIARDAIKDAEKDVMTGVHQQRSQKYGRASDDTSPMGIPSPISDKCALTHATTIEFLHQFWDGFLSGDSDRAMEVQYLAESLARSMARIQAVADEAEVERENIIQKRKQEIRSHFERTGKKIRWKPDMVGGGRDVVSKIMQPTLDALRRAQETYSKALGEEGIQISTESA
ncbi:rna polymerase ii transcription factor b subunit 1 [Trichoderma arundinaceum]|uniref:Rna polymerase ii transcription factor b subunit 1 n=1 Tax=Trichoderma arundinaceum TaxID=490622 RepID=A0A395NXQ3_TRIAR|nr:rna polymerase ii transcription factor b subunit 1 [Trichoderma arundinaceum]